MLYRGIEESAKQLCQATSSSALFVLDKCPKCPVLAPCWLLVGCLHRNSLWTDPRRDPRRDSRGDPLRRGIKGQCMAYPWTTRGRRHSLHHPHRSHPLHTRYTSEHSLNRPRIVPGSSLDRRRVSLFCIQHSVYSLIRRWKPQNLRRRFHSPPVP